MDSVTIAILGYFAFIVLVFLWAEWVIWGDRWWKQLFNWRSLLGSKYDRKH